MPLSGSSLPLRNFQRRGKGTDVSRCRHGRGRADCTRPLTLITKTSISIPLLSESKYYATEHRRLTDEHKVGR